MKGFLNSFFLAVFLSTVVGFVNLSDAAPSELNFQGVLLDSSGNGVTGTRAMTVKLYDAAIGGNLLYTEDLGNVSINKGVYSFNFGTNGTGNPKVTETVTVADGTTSTFQKVLTKTNVVTGSVSVTDGTYNWDQVNGPSDGGVNFDASYSTALRRITVNYYTGAPAAGKIVRVTYRSPSAGLAGILTNENDPWMEISVAGQVQSPRQKLLAVPFAMRASSVEGSTYQETIEIDLPIKRFNTKRWISESSYNTDFGEKLPIGVGFYGSGPGTTELMFDVPFFIKEILSVSINYSVSSYSINGISYKGRIDFWILDSQNQQLIGDSFPRVETTSANRVIPVAKTVPSGENYRILIVVKPGNDVITYGNSYGGGTINSVTAKVKVLKSMGFQ